MDFTIRRTDSRKYTEVIVEEGSVKIDLGLLNEKEVVDLISTLVDAAWELSEICIDNSTTERLLHIVSETVGDERNRIFTEEQTKQINQLKNQ